MPVDLDYSRGRIDDADVTMSWGARCASLMLYFGLLYRLYCPQA
jgi:hypothetical protein